MSIRTADAFFAKPTRNPSSPLLLSITKLSQPLPVVTPETFRSPPLSPTFWKSRELLRISLENAIRRYGTRHLLFVTVTFDSQVTSTAHAHGKLNSFLNRIRKRYPGNLWVMEPQKSNRIHYHLLIATDTDVQKGTYVRGFEPHLGHSRERKRDFMGPGLLVEADWLEKKAHSHGFGRTDVAPIYSEDPQALVYYLLKQQWRSRPWPFDEKKYVRFWGCSKSFRAGNIQFSWVGEKARAFRMKLRQWILDVLQVKEDETERARELESTGFGLIGKVLGSRWFLMFRTWLRFQPDDDTDG